ncbi:zf-HC2 domain-containing protein [Planctomycetota bacterium]
MNCQEARMHIFLYLDGDLSGERKEEVCDHLAQCNGCSAMLEQEKGFQNVVKSRCREEAAPLGLADRILESLEEGGGSEAPSEHKSALPGGKKIARPAPGILVLHLAAGLLFVVGILMVIKLMQSTHHPGESHYSGTFIAGSLASVHSARLQNNLAIQTIFSRAALQSWMDDQAEKDPGMVRVCVPDASNIRTQLRGGAVVGMPDGRRGCLCCLDGDECQVSFFCFKINVMDLEEEYLTNILGRKAFIQEQGETSVVIWTEGNCWHSLVANVPKKQLEEIAYNFLR